MPPRDTHSRERRQRTQARLGRQRGAKVARVDRARQLAEAIWHVVRENEPPPSIRQAPRSVWSLDDPPMKLGRRSSLPLDLVPLAEDHRKLSAALRSATGRPLTAGHGFVYQETLAIDGEALFIELGSYGAPVGNAADPRSLALAHGTKSTTSLSAGRDRRDGRRRADHARTSGGPRLPGARLEPDMIWRRAQLGGPISSRAM